MTFRHGLSPTLDFDATASNNKRPGRPEARIPKYAERSAE